MSSIANQAINKQQQSGTTALFFSPTNNSNHSNVSIRRSPPPSASSSATTTTPIFHLNEHDVLYGRGSGPNDYTGNIAYRDLICSQKDDYRAASRKDKSRIASDIVQHVQKLGGRFLEKDSPEKGAESKSVAENSPVAAGVDRSSTVDDKHQQEAWYVVDDKRAEVKTKQALRQHYVGEDNVPLVPFPSATTSNSFATTTSSPSSMMTSLSLKDKKDGHDMISHNNISSPVL
eukprot:CAMPEP_0194393010 /NCGR_PEP_ID=MMETSP0174-20130528/123058_1 /TAXON_ID=216777 /ORGANISM="Proboscia alata, Strain PI-D3" /LENGTH=231 /DNA_ID=CAMNT_0039188641 /DNA_START=2404 /DNA_END=3096 /DNA_ORIENTATION=+